MRRRSLFNAACIGMSLIVVPTSAPMSGGVLAASAQVAPPSLESAIAAYKAKLEEYTQAREAYEIEVRSYWDQVATLRRARNVKRRDKAEIGQTDYVLTQPPVYSGPPQPVNPAPEIVPSPPAPPPKRYIPVVADFLQAAADEFDFKPQLPKTEIDFKKAYAKVAAAAGLTREQAARIYGFEAGGNGRYDVQAGLEYPRPDAHAISTALGYNQLLSTNSVELLAEQGDRFVKALSAKVEAVSGARRRLLEKKLAVLRRMIEVATSVPDEWGEHEKLGKTSKGLAIHALNLDIDIGPLLQTQKLLDSVEFAKRKGYEQPLTAAELEMMNLTGDGSGFDMVSMPAALREKVPTANFFQRNGYAANRVAIVNDTVVKLIKATDAKMDKESKLPGARALASQFP